MESSHHPKISMLDGEDEDKEAEAEKKKRDHDKKERDTFLKNNKNPLLKNDITN